MPAPSTNSFVKNPADSIWANPHNYKSLFSANIILSTTYCSFSMDVVLGEN